MIASVRERESIMPEGSRSRRVEQDIGWQPWELSDIAVRSDRYAVTDRRAASVTVFSTDLARRVHWERKGNGPGELQSPTQVRFDPRGDSLWILDRGRSRIVGFDLDGNFGRELAISGNVIGFDLAIDGRFFVVHEVIASTARGSITVISELLADGKSVPMVNVDASMIGPPEFILPGPNRPRVKALGNSIGLLLPAAGIVVLYEPHSAGFRRTRSIATCMPEELAKAYAAQLQSGVNRQTSIALVGDVVRRGDTLFTVNNRRDNKGRYGIQRFNVVTGENYGSIAITAGPINVPVEVRFRLGDDLGLVAMDPLQGFVVNLRVSVER